MGSSPDRVKPKTIILVFAASPLRTQHRSMNREPKVKLMVHCLILVVSFYQICEFYIFRAFSLYANVRPCKSIEGMLAPSEGDCGFKPRSCQTKDYNIGICCFSAKDTASRSKSKERLAWNLQSF
jgi:hypothetical protein